MPQPDDAEEEKSYVRVDLGRRVVYLGGEVNPSMAVQAIAALECLDATDGDINLVINSSGGNEQDGYAIFDTITMCKNKVIATGYGSVMSIMAAIFQAADIRRMSPNTQFMVHNGTIGGEEKMQQDAVLDMAEQIRKDNRRYYNILATASGQPMEAIEAYCREETYFTAQEAFEAGFVDEVMVPCKKQWAPKKSKRSKRK